MRRPLLPLLSALLVGAPLAAQSFGDGPAFGGSLIFSEGLNPLGNSARYDRAGQGFALGYENGDAKPRGFTDASRDLDQGRLSGDAPLQQRGLQGLHDRPAALRRTAYGVSWTEKGGLLFAYGREETQGFLVTPDTDPTHTGAGLSLNGTQAVLRHTMVDRVVIGTGGGGGVDQPSYGVRVRAEHIRWGASDPAAGIAFGTSDAFLNASVPTQRRASVINLDAGYELPIAPNFRMGLTADHLIPHTYWGGVESKAQFRAGAEFALTQSMTVRVESDLNQVERLPLPGKQRSAAASVRLDLGGTLLQLGAERRTLADQSSTVFGASLYFTFSGTRLGVGLQFGDDRPQRSGMVRFNG
jgi:hypothetical protein